MNGAVVYITEVTLSGSTYLKVGVSTSVKKRCKAVGAGHKSSLVKAIFFDNRRDAFLIEQKIHHILEPFRWSHWPTEWYEGDRKEILRKFDAVIASLDPTLHLLPMKKQNIIPDATPLRVVYDPNVQQRISSMTLFTHLSKMS